VPPEVESILNRISSNRNVRGVMVLSREGPIIRSSGAVFEGDSGRRYASAVKKIVDTCKAGLDEAVEGGARSLSCPMTTSY
jgi:dynein light chain roadblock-type